MATSAAAGPSSAHGSVAGPVTLGSRPALTNSARLQHLRSQNRKPGEASFFYFDNHFRNEAVKVLPGEFFVYNEDILIMTTLGSCIAACIWDRDRRVGGMNHFMLPEGTGDRGRYGSFAMDQLIGELVKRGATRSSMEAKVFGGGAVLGGMNTINVGQRNTSFVLDYLRTERIPVVRKAVLEIYPRKVCFLPASGKAMVKRLAATHSEAFVEQDRVAQQRTAQPAAGGSIDLC